MLLRGCARYTIVLNGERSDRSGRATNPDVAPLLHEDATIEVTATGVDPESGERRTVSGMVVDRYDTGSSAGNRYPTLPG